MEMKINDIDYAYDILKTDHDFSETDNDSDLEYETNRVMHDPIELPYPLKSSVFVCRKINGRYSAGILIEQRDDNAFKNISRGLERKIALNGEKFFTTSKDGTGYIIDRELSLETPKEASLCITEAEEKARIIVIGCRGTRPRILSDRDSFIESINYLQKYSNFFLDVVYEGFFGKKTKDYKIPKDFVVYSVHNSP